MTQSELEALVEQKLASSGISENFKELGIKPHISPPFKGNFPQLPGFTITYKDFDGEPTGFMRYRYLVDTRTGFEKLTNSKGLRYIQPPQSGVHVYVPQNFEWERPIRENHPIFITEGELKALAAASHGFPCIALGGVWSFLQDGELIQFFTDMTWVGRHVYIVFDSDASSNPNVAAAENRLAHTLASMKAIPHVIRLPAPNGKKVGLDDYLLEHDEDEFQKLVDDAPIYKEVRPLHELNEQVMVVLNPSMVIEPATGYMMNKNNFTGVNYAHLSHWEEKTTADGEVKRKRVPTAEAWIKWPGRSVVTGITFAPGQDRVYRGKYNTWKGWKYKPKEGNIKPWKDILKYAFQDEPQYQKWFEQWAAYPLQHPGQKLSTDCVFYGVHQGTGKTFIGLSLKEIYGDYGVQIAEEDLHDDRNEWMINKQFILGDEVTGSDKSRVEDRLKGLATQKQVRINQKYVPSYFQEDCMNYFFTSNRVNAFVMANKDRRHFILEMAHPALDPSFYREYEKWLYYSDGEGPSALFAHLLSVDLSDFNPQGWAPETKAKREMIQLGRSDIASWVVELIESPGNILPPGKDLFTNQELLMLYDPEGRKKLSANGLGRILKEYNVYRPNNGDPIMHGGKSFRLYAVRNADKWKKATNTQLAEHYNGKKPLR